MKIALAIFISDAGKDLFRIWYGFKTAASMEVRCSIVSASIPLHPLVEMNLWWARHVSVVSPS